MIKEWLKDKKVQESYINVPDGRVFCRIVGEGKEAPLLVLHGGPGYPHNYLLPLADLSNERPVIFYDQLGCGRSDKPNNITLWQIDRFVEELKIVVGELLHGNYHLLGHSWGTMLAVDFMLTLPRNIKSLVLSGPCLSVPRFEKDTQNLVTKLPEETRQKLLECKTKNAWGSSECDEAYDVFRYNYDCRIVPDPPEMEASEQGFGEPVYETMWGENEITIFGNLKKYDRTDDLTKIKCPTLFTCGRFDECTPEATSFYSSHLSNSRVKVFEKSAHNVHLEETKLYLAEIRKFLAEND